MSFLIWVQAQNWEVMVSAPQNLNVVGQLKKINPPQNCETSPINILEKMSALMNWSFLFKNL